MPDAGRPGAIRTDPVEGASIGPYRLVERVGSGAHATVYRAYRDDSLAPVAVKLFHRALDGKSLDRVWREMGLLESARLPCVPRLLDHGQIDGRPFLVTELIDGLDLDQHCRVRSLDRSGRIELLARVADAVQAIHDAGIAHRDLKPSNVVVDGRGCPVILDLGTAVATGRDDVRLTLTGAPVGTPAFMSPEQARGERLAHAEASDVWSLGAIGWQLLVGRTPHEPAASLVELLQRRATCPPRSVLEQDPSLPGELAAVLDTAVAFAPPQRYATAAEFAADLRRAGCGQAVRSRPARGGWHTGRIGSVGALIALSLATLWWAAVSTAGRTFVARPPAMPSARTVSIDPTGRYAWLQGPAGRVLWELDGEAERSLSCAALLEPADDPSGRGLLLVGASADSPAVGSGRLVAFDLDAMAAQRWSAGDVGADLVPPPWISQVDGSRFGIAAIRVLDVFPQPGKELVVIHQHHPSSPACIRIYEATGRVLYEVWHDGHVADLRWLPAAGLLVLAGVNAEAFWDERGVTGVDHPWYPMVLCAVRPAPIRAGFIRTPGGLGTVEPVWYQTLLPAELAAGRPSLDEPRTALEPPGHGLTADRFFRLCVTVGKAPPKSLAFVFDDAGREVVQLREAKSSYQATPGLPDHRVFSFGPLPAISQRRPGREIPQKLP